LLGPGEPGVANDGDLEVDLLDLIDRVGVAAEKRYLCGMPAPGEPLLLSK
jgi:hypothetical protein